MATGQTTKVANQIMVALSVPSRPGPTSTGVGCYGLNFSLLPSNVVTIAAIIPLRVT
jgi:hypothetical protein